MATLSDRLSKARALLADVLSILDKNPGRISAGVETKVRDILLMGDEIPKWQRSLEARDGAFEAMVRLELKRDPDKLFPFGTTRLTYTHTRFLLVQAYLMTTWALVDRFTDLIGKVSCIESVASHPTQSARLVANIIKDSKYTTVPVYSFTRDNHGWPICLSYAVRNLFAHDTGERDAWSFFAGYDDLSAFRVSDEGWNYIVDQAEKGYKVRSIHTRAPEPWPDGWHKDDLRQLLALCHRELDDATGVLLCSACYSLKGHISLLVGLE